MSTKVFPAELLKSMPAEFVAHGLREYSASMSQKKRELEQWEKDECAALKQAIAAWNQARPKEQRMTQEQAGEALGMNQGSFSNYLNGRTAINLDFSLRIFDVFGIPIDVYSKRLAAELMARADKAQENQDVEFAETIEKLTKSNRRHNGGGEAFEHLGAFLASCDADGMLARRRIIRETRNRLAHEPLNIGDPRAKLARMFYALAAAQIDGNLSDQDMGILSYVVMAIDARYEDNDLPLTAANDNPMSNRAASK